MDFGLHNCLARSLLTHQSGQECFKRSLQTGIDELQKTITNLDSRLDKQRFLKYNNAAFMLPKKFEFQGHKGDEVRRLQDLIVMIHDINNICGLVDVLIGIYYIKACMMCIY